MFLTVFTTARTVSYLDPVENFTASRHACLRSISVILLLTFRNKLILSQNIAGLYSMYIRVQLIETCDVCFKYFFSKTNMECLKHCIFKETQGIIVLDPVICCIQSTAVPVEFVKDAIIKYVYSIRFTDG
jgi:hypothetical protein